MWLKLTLGTIYCRGGQTVDHGRFQSRSSCCNLLLVNFIISNLFDAGPIKIESEIIKIKSDTSLKARGSENYFRNLSSEEKTWSCLRNVALRFYIHTYTFWIDTFVQNSIFSHENDKT